MDGGVLIYNWSQAVSFPCKQSNFSLYYRELKALMRAEWQISLTISTL